MLWRNSRGGPINAPAAFIHPCQPIVAKQPPSGPGWAHELKHDGYRLQMIHVRDGRGRCTRWTGGYRCGELARASLAIMPLTSPRNTQSNG
jgi:hypothetical protein